MLGENLLKVGKMPHLHATTRKTHESGFSPDSLLLETELFDNRVVAALVVLLEVAEVRTTVSDHLEKSAAGVEILGVFLEMLGQLVDLTGKNSDLDIRRASVSVVAGRVFNNGRLYAFG